MLKKAKGTSALKKSNKQKIINCIRLNHPISRTDIVKKVGVSKSTVTRIVEELINSSIIEEAGMGDSTAGRRPIYLKLKNDAYICVGVNISPKTVSVSIIDLEKNILARKKFNMTKQETVPEWFSFIEKLTKTIKDVLLKQNVDPAQILGIGIGMGIPVVIENNEIILFNNSQQDHLKKSLQEEFNLPVFIDNNPNTRILGEFWYGLGKGFKDVLYIVLGECIGVGVLAGGEVVKGSSNMSGKLGHTKAVYKGRTCICGEKGCLEAYCSTDSIENIYKEKTGKEITFKEIIDLSLEGDSSAKEIVDYSMELISMKISDLIYLYNPEVIIFAGELLESNKEVFPNLVSQVNDITLPSFLSNIKYYHRHLDTELYSVGAAVLVYKDYFGY